jgi:MYXO-CTERM domain-containing protein
MSLDPDMVGPAARVLAFSEHVHVDPRAVPSDDPQTRTRRANDLERLARTILPEIVRAAQREPDAARARSMLEQAERFMGGGLWPMLDRGDRIGTEQWSYIWTELAGLQRLTGDTLPVTTTQRAPAAPSRAAAPRAPRAPRREREHDDRSLPEAISDGAMAGGMGALALVVVLGLAFRSRRR